MVHAHTHKRSVRLRVVQRAAMKDDGMSERTKTRDRERSERERESERRVRKRSEGERNKQRGMGESSERM